MCRPCSRRTGIHLPKGLYNGNGLRSEPCPGDTLRGPCLEAAMGRTPETDIGRVQHVPLATGAEHEEEGIRGFPSIDAGMMALVGTMQRRFHAFPDQGTNPKA